MMRHAKKLLSWVIAASVAACPFVAEAADIWLAPPDPVTQHNQDFPLFFDNPAAWSRAAANIAVFSVTANYLVRSPKDVVQRQLAFLRSHGIKLDVSILAMTADKHICGNGIEGMVWPGEPAAYARQIKALGADVDTFSFDWPLTSGHTLQRENACKYSVREAAHRLGAVARTLMAAFPNVKFVDQEPPNAMSLPAWKQTLSEWLTDFQAEAGVPMYAMSMDLNWPTAWTMPAIETAQLLRGKGVKVGVFINAGGGATQTADAWTAAVKRNVCSVRATAIAPDYLEVSNWEQMRVPNLPETNPGSLTSVVNWVAAGGGCAP
jgi:hypothetical protein